MSDPSPAILLGGSPRGPARLLARFANRHGLVAGATGTGKTVTLQVLAEGFSDLGVPVLLADAKGDLSGLGLPGTPRKPFQERARALGLSEGGFRAYPVLHWDVFGREGHPLRATVSDVGPLLLARLMGLNEVQTGVLNLVFKVADDEGLLLIDLKDLRAVLAFVAENSRQFSASYGSVSAASVGAIQRQLLALETQGAEHFLGEPALDLADLMQVAPDGRGAVNVLAAAELMERPALYATVLTWLLAELFEALPEAGDLERPKLVLFFDEAHLLFNGAPKALVERVEQVVRLIRSKGVGVYFITQNPLDVPESVLGQLGNRVQHALRAFTPRDQRAVKVAAETFRPNPRLDTARAITELAVGEALVSCLDEKGTPMPVERVLIRPPLSRVGPASPEERRQAIAQSPLAGRYEQAVDRDSAFEMLNARAGSGMLAGEPPPPPAPADWSSPWGPPRQTAPRPPATRPPTTPAPSGGSYGYGQGGYGAPRPPARSGGGGRQRMTLTEHLVSSAVRTVGSSVGRAIVRGLLGSILKR
ncbi:MAG: DUF853 domain-containing protein [Thalassobaculales bacterium]